MAKPEVTCTSSVAFFLQNKDSTLIFIDILWLFLIKQFACLGGYVRRQAPGTEKKTALKVKPLDKWSRPGEGG